MTVLAWAIAGLLWPTLLVALPGVATVCLIAGAAIAALLSGRMRVFWFLACSAWVLLHLAQGLDRRLPQSSPQPVTLSGQITGLPVRREDMLEFRFRVARQPAAGLPGNALLLVRWYRQWPEVQPGETWQLQVRLKPARARVNFSGADTERWYFSQGIVALASVVPGFERRIAAAGKLHPDSLRASVSRHLAHTLDGHPAAPLLQALAVADRTQVAPQQWNLLRLTGTSHLLAISGMHIGLAGITGFWLGRLLLLLAPVGVLLRLGNGFCWSAAFCLASGYAVLAGMGSSTQRAIIMLACSGLLILSKRLCSPWKVLQIALFLILVMQPLAPFEAGLWLSFGAVAVLLAVFASRPAQQPRFARLLMAQAALILVMLPLGMLWFQQFSLLGLVTNLFAIPWVSCLVVPALLGSILAMPLDMLMDTTVSPFLAYMSAEALRYLVRVLEWTIAYSPPVWGMTQRPGNLAFILALGGSLLLLLPRGMNIRWCGLLMLTLTLVRSTAPGRAWQVEMLDVGQGLSVLLAAGERLLVYDSGPGEPDKWSLVPSVVMPAIADHGRSAPDRIMISHADLDHAGGMQDLQLRYPYTPLSNNPPGPGNTEQGCLAGQRWQWEGASFEVLHPGPGLPYLGNDSSCVLHVQLGASRFLLMGDAGLAVEQRLIARGIGPYDYLFAGHHGSRSASGGPFIERIRPAAALISTGFEHRFGFPHEEVAARFAARSIPLWSTADCGAIRIRGQDLSRTDDMRLRTGISAGQGVVIESARRTRKALWRWPAHADCP